MDGSLVGRDPVVDAARAALDATGRVLLDGPAGIGKTAVLTALTTHAAEQGALVLRCAPAETEAALPLAAIADLLAPLTHDLATLPPPQHRAARNALLIADDAGPVDERALASAVVTLLDRAAQAGPAGVLVTIDDAPWLDPPSERALRFALRRTPASVRVLVTRRSGPGGNTRVPLELDARSPVEVLTLAPLGTGPLHHLLAHRFGVALSRPVIARLARESGGNPLLAIELTRAILRLPRMPGPGSDLPVPASMHELVEASLATLRAGELRAVRLAALLFAPNLPDLIAADVQPDHLDAAEEAGLIVVDAARVRFTHPVLASAVRASIPPGVRRRLHSRLAQSSTDPDERARHLSRSTTHADDDVRDLLVAAAERAHTRGAPELAAEFYDRAAEITTEAASADRLRLRALSCLFDCGSYQLAAERADAMAQNLRGDALADALLLRAAIAFSADEVPLAAAIAQRALAAAVPQTRLAGRIHAHLAVFLDDPVRGHEHAAAALALLQGIPPDGDPGPAAGGILGRTDQALLASVLMSVFLSEVRSGMPPRVELLEQALELEDGTPSWLAGTIPAIWWKGIDDHARAKDRLEWMLDVATDAGDEPQRHELMQHLAQAEILAGDYERAAGWIAGARELADQLGAATAAERWLGGVLDAHRGNLGAARAAADGGLAESAVSGDPWLRRISLELAAFVALAEGRAGDAADAYADLCAALDATGLVESLTSRFEADWVEACVGVGDLVTAEIACQRAARRHARLPRPSTALGLARSRVLIAGAAGHDTAALVDALVAVREATPVDVVPFERARCLHVAGLAHRRARRKRAAREALLGAATEFDALGATTFAARARADARRTGGRAAAPRDLTDSELRVAELAAAGRTNREIAEALFISPKTVEANLARAYRKLAIGRRVELATALRDLLERET